MPAATYSTDHHQLTWSSRGQRWWFLYLQLFAYEQANYGYRLRARETRRCAKKEQAKAIERRSRRFEIRSVNFE